jgi:hypothetical protein
VVSLLERINLLKLGMAMATRMTNTVNVIINSVKVKPRIRDLVTVLATALRS